MPRITIPPLPHVARCTIGWYVWSGFLGWMLWDLAPFWLFATAMGLLLAFPPVLWVVLWLRIRARPVLTRHYTPRRLPDIDARLERLGADLLATSRDAAERVMQHHPHHPWDGTLSYTMPRVHPPKLNVTWRMPTLPADGRHPLSVPPDHLDRLLTPHFAQMSWPDRWLLTQAIQGHTWSAPPGRYTAHQRLQLKARPTP